MAPRMEEEAFLLCGYGGIYQRVGDFLKSCNRSKDKIVRGVEVGDDGLEVKLKMDRRSQSRLDRRTMLVLKLSPLLQQRQFPDII